MGLCFPRLMAMYWQTLKIAMKKLILALTFTLLSALVVNAQKGQQSTPTNSLLSLQISQQVDPVYDFQGKMIEGQAQVFFTLSDSSTVKIETVVAENEILRRKLSTQMEGMQLNARPEDLNKSMNIRIYFTQK